MYFDPEQVPTDTDHEWSEDSDFWWGTITGDTGRSDNVRWKHDGNVYSFTGLTKELLHTLIERNRDNPLNGYKYWCYPNYEGRTLSNLRNSGASGDDLNKKTTPESEPDIIAEDE